MTTELDLARRALDGDAAALRELDARLLPEVRRVCGGPGAFTDEVAQLVREKLLVGPSPRLAQFDGSGPLAGWLRVVASRTASNLRRGDERVELASTVPERQDSNVELEVALLRAQYHGPFRAAFAEAVARLEPEDRTVLRLHALDGLSLASIGTMFRKDASSISRWLARLRQRLLEDTRAGLQSRLALESAEVESVMRLADSALSRSLAGLLGAG